MNDLLLSLIIFIIVYLINLEFNPGLGNIYIRPNESNQKILVLKNIIPFFVLPFRNLNFWKPSLWDVNPYTLFLIIFIIISGLSYLYKNL